MGLKRVVIFTLYLDGRILSIGLLELVLLLFRFLVNSCFSVEQKQHCTWRFDTGFKTISSGLMTDGRVVIYFEL